MSLDPQNACAAVFRRDIFLLGLKALLQRASSVGADIGWQLCEAEVGQALGGRGSGRFRLFFAARRHLVTVAFLGALDHELLAVFLAIVGTLGFLADGEKHYGPKGALHLHF